ncbi:hypothetical protein, partial [Enterobacter bugandensis]
MFILTAIIMFICMFMFFLHDVLNDRGFYDYWGAYQESLYVLLVISFIISGLIAFFAYKAYSLTCCKLAEEIFYLMGIKNVSTVNLNRLT